MIFSFYNKLKIEPFLWNIERVGDIPIFILYLLFFTKLNVFQ